MEGEGCNSGVAMDSGNPLLRAVFLRRLRLTRLLLEGGAYINESDSQGQTPLMVACRTQHVDAQSASRVKLVQFLLEKGADPDIQDKEGRSALMHACQEHAGPEVVSLLLGSGADISLEDQSGTSALVYAVMAGDWTVLKLLLDTCKAKGKEVIIINTDKLPCGKLQAKQYLSMSPLGPLDQTDKITSAAPASPSDIQLITSPQCTSSSLCPPKSIFSFKEGQSCGVSSHPCSPSRLRGLSQAAANRLQQPLLRLNSEPWLKIPSSLPSSQNGQDFNQTEDLSFRVPKLDGFKWYEGRLPMDKGVEGAGKNDCAKHAGQKISLPGLLSSHSASHPNLHSENLGTDSIASSSSSSFLSGGKNHVTPLHSMASSSLHSIIQRRKLGADIYSSDPQLALDMQTLPGEQRARGPIDGKKLAPLRCSSTLGSRESGPNRRVLSGYERRGSGAFLLDHNSQARPRSLPPLTLSSTNAPVLNVYNSSAGGGFSEKETGLKHFLPSAPPGHPKELTRRMLLRRHSMQTEQFKTTA
ncbi:ankyrin repeat domain-containing protein 34B-like [Seriola lalandi dorsalis]|uniref:ankyrin repeat domain-containing protein 34B-like n=1 Tax=Seriola lalandi dorsalis TaxID=1841481 RepID=UPI000C6F6055|nr:ankyrin repeat domain-containing protein 34B-like [Seriola lalandi dorsalis]XP_056259793.1 ankyrin repeat domain-containing protein 34B [Seriola aureovittata]